MQLNAQLNEYMWNIFKGENIPFTDVNLHNSLVLTRNNITKTLHFGGEGKKRVGKNAFLKMF